MGDFLSGILGTNSGVAVQQNVNPYEAMGPLQQQQAALLSQLQAQSAGGGPNPAQLQFQQNAQQIAQQGAAANAQNRAINPGLAARMSGEQAAQIGGQAAGSAGIQQAQQQLASQQLLGNTISGGLGAINQASSINAGIAGGNQKAASGIIGGLLNAGGSAAGLADGGVVAPKSEGSTDSSGPSDFRGFNLNGAAPSGQDVNGIPNYFSSGGEVLPAHLQTIANIYGSNMSAGGLLKENPKTQQVPEKDRFSSGGKVPTMVSPGERYLPPQDAKRVAKKQESPMRAGEKIPGKAPVKGDSSKNDIVPKKLEEGGVVIPRSIFESDNPEKEAQAFVARVLAEHKKSPEGEFKEALKRAVSGRKNKNAA